MRGGKMLGVLLAAMLAATPLAANAADEAALEQARLVIRKTNALALTEQVLPIIATQIVGLLRNANPAQGDLAQKIFEEYGLPTFRKRMPEMGEVIAQVYANRFTADELRQVGAFYDTSVGRKLIDQMPGLTQDSMAAGAAWGQSVAQDVLKQMMPELEKRGLKAPI